MTTGQGSYIVNLRLLVNPFQLSVAFDIETSQLICTANGFEMGYITNILVMHGFLNKTLLREKVLLLLVS